MHYDKITRLLHWGFATLIPLQLLSESFMKRPKLGRIRDDMQIFFFEMHEWIGMIALVLIIARIAWGFVGAEGGWARLFPYATCKGLKGLKEEVRTEIPGWFKGNIAAPGKESFVAGMIHGFGLLLVLGFAVTGATMFYGMEESGKMTGFVHDAKELHEMMGGLLWVYIFGHVGMVVVHQLLGHDMFKRIFSLKS